MVGDQGAFAIKWAAYAVENPAEQFIPDWHLFSPINSPPFKVFWLIDVRVRAGCLERYDASAWRQAEDVIRGHQVEFFA